MKTFLKIVAWGLVAFMAIAVGYSLTRSVNRTLYVNGTETTADEVSICGTYEMADNERGLSGTIVIDSTSTDDRFWMSYSGADIFLSRYDNSSTQISTAVCSFNYVKTTNGKMCYRWYCTDPSPRYYFVVYEDDENFESIYYQGGDGYMYRFDRV